MQKLIIITIALTLFFPISYAKKRDASYDFKMGSSSIRGNKYNNSVKIDLPTVDDKKTELRIDGKSKRRSITIKNPLGNFNIKI